MLLLILLRFQTIGNSKLNNIITLNSLILTVRFKRKVSVYMKRIIEADDDIVICMS